MNIEVGKTYFVDHKRKGKFNLLVKQVKEDEITGTRLVHTETITKEIEVDFTLDEVKKLFLEKSPTVIIITKYSTKTPCMYITKQIMPSDMGVFMYYNSWADKTPRFYDWESFYHELKLNGLGNIKI